MVDNHSGCFPRFFPARLLTAAAGPRLLLEVTLDLRRAQVGSYFLATVRESDNGTYYYPLKVQKR